MILLIAQTREFSAMEKDTDSAHYSMRYAKSGTKYDNIMLFCIQYNEIVYTDGFAYAS